MKRTLFLCFSKKHSFKDFYNFVKNNLSMCILFVFLMLGIVTGSVVSKNADAETIAGLDVLFNGNLSLRTGQSIIENFVASFTSYFIFILMSFLLGLSLWGSAVIPFVVMLRGFGTGLSGGYLCARYGILGFSFNAFVLLPGVFVSSIALVFASREAINFSMGMISKFSKLKFFAKYDKGIHIKTFFVRTGVLIFFVAVAATLDVFLTKTFAGFFNLN